MNSESDKLEFVELGRLSFGDWARLTGGERSPFGETEAMLEFRPRGCARTPSLGAAHGPAQDACAATRSRSGDAVLRAPLVRLYARRGYQEIVAPVWVDQPAGPLQMPLRTMWRPLRPVDWPPGVVRLDGLPF